MFKVTDKTNKFSEKHFENLTKLKAFPKAQKKVAEKLTDWDFMVRKFKTFSKVMHSSDGCRNFFQLMSTFSPEI